ncbi:hypothetical protein [Bauldia sp.]|uniref:hypothetical protein n=1 Tax=Bauldia sp. TaxID=2575872 RepID=UPI003BABB209
MPTQTSDITVPIGSAIEFSKSGQKWKIDKNVSVGATDTAIFSAFTDSTLVNKGYVYSDDDDGALFTKNNAMLINKDTGHINGGFYGVSFIADTPTDAKGSVENHGKIFGDTGGVRNANLGDFTVDNHGEIYGDIYGIFAKALFAGSTSGPVIKNFNSIKSDQRGIYVNVTDSTLRSKVVNQKDGVIKGGTFDEGYAAVFNQNGDMTLINKGTIKGDVWSSTGDEDAVTNTGKIKGDVRLGFEDDKLDNRDGNITGYILGGAGKDKLIAGDKKEKFVFNDLADFDRVKNFESGKDKFFLAEGAFGDLTAGPLAKSAFRKGTEAKDADDRIIYDKDTGKLYIDSNGNAGGGQVQFAKVDPGQKLKYSDFTVELFAV